MQANQRTIRARSRGNRLTVFEVVIIALVIALAVLFVMNALRTPAAPEVGTREYRVHTSDTLWDLAERFPVDGLTTAQTVDLLRDINSMEGSSLAVGDAIVVPVDGPEVALAQR